MAKSKAEIAKDTYREPSQPRRCSNCERGDYDTAGHGWWCFLMRREVGTYGVCDCYEEAIDG